jgi:hypothetical protein
MRISKCVKFFLAGVVTFGAVGFLLVPAVFAVVGVTSSELQDSASIVVPSGDSIDAIEGYSNFALETQANISGGIQAQYEARLTQDPWLSEELPRVQLLVFSYSDQDTAEAAFEASQSSTYFPGSAERTVLDSDDRTIFYSAETSTAADIFGTLNAEYTSLHLLHVNGNLLYHVSFYREHGDPDHYNLQAFVTAVKDTELIRGLLDGVLDSTKLALGILFLPSNTELSTKSEKSSLALSSLYDIPQNGSAVFDLYIGESEGAVGTILDSSGIGFAEEGDMYLYINSDGRLFAGIYAPDFDADCSQESGWYRVETSAALDSYEWNEVELHWGVGGLWIGIDGVTSESCSVSQPFSENELYLGDYPNDSIDESGIAYVDEVSFEYSVASTGETWDGVLEDQLFLDLPSNDPDVDVFYYLKEAGIFTGSSGMLYPDTVLNRAEMVKVLLRAFDYEADEGGYIPFWDVPEDAWYRKYLARAYSIGMVSGNPDLSFAPGGHLNNAEFYTMLYRVAEASGAATGIVYGGEFEDVDSEDWYADGAAYAAAYSLIDNDYFAPISQVSRRDAAQSLYTVLNQ